MQNKKHKTHLFSVHFEPGATLSASYHCLWNYYYYLLFSPQMMNLKLRGIKQLAQDHTVCGRSLIPFQSYEIEVQVFLLSVVGNKKVHQNQW